MFELMALSCCFSALVLSKSVWSEQANHYLVWTVLFAFVNTCLVQFALWSFGLYSREVVYSGRRMMSNLAGSFIFSVILLLPSSLLLGWCDQVFDVGFRFHLVGLVGFMSVVAIERTLVLRNFNDTPYLGNILILGTGEATQQVVTEARRNHGQTFRLVGGLSEDPSEVGRAVDGCSVVGSIGEIDRVVREKDVGGIIISMPVHSPLLPTDFLLKCKLNGIMVRDATEFYENVGKKLLLEKLDPIQLLYSENLLMTRFRWRLKLMTEQLIAIVLLILSSPVLLLTAALIKLLSPGPILYKQDRVGKDGKIFKVIKFRSMIPAAEQNGKAVWAQEGDPRVTPFGRFLRKFRIDELPQLFNVLKGDMAIVGPRPERPEFVKQLQGLIPFYGDRHLVLPGITGWAQVVYPYGSSFADAREKLRYDLYYIKNMSFLFDALIILSTIRTVLFGKGGR